MPKFGRAHDTSITFGCHHELRNSLIALGYLRGSPGEIATIARNILKTAVDEYIVQLDPDERREYYKILKNVDSEWQVLQMRVDERERLKLGRTPQSST